MPKKLSDIPKVVRHQKIYNILRFFTSEDNSLTVSDIHAKLIKDDINTSQKTIQRDLMDMSSTHKIMATETRPARWYCSAECDLDYELTFSESDLKTIALALRSLREISDTFQRTLCERTEATLLSKLPKNIAADFEKLSSYTIVSPSLRTIAGVESSIAYKTILKALKEERVIRCENHSPYKDESYRKIQRTFSPLKLNMVGGEQYLLVQDHMDNKVKRLKVCRMKNIEIRNEKVDQNLLANLNDLDMSIGGYGSPGMESQIYEIYCDELMATLFEEKKMHPNQVVEKVNGEYVIRFESYQSIEIARYLSGWSKHIRHVNPKSVMDDMQEIWEAGLKRVPQKRAA